jgi:acyl carrier protein
MESQMGTRERINSVFQDVFNDPKLQVQDHWSAKDIRDWDSLNHVRLVTSIEQEFSIRFSVKEVSSTKNVGEFVALIEKKMGVRSA